MIPIVSWICSFSTVSHSIYLWVPEWYLWSIILTINFPVLQLLNPYDIYRFIHYHQMSFKELQTDQKLLSPTYYFLGHSDFSPLFHARCTLSVLFWFTPLALKRLSPPPLLVGISSTHPSPASPISLSQWFSIGVLQEFLKHTIPDYFVRNTNLFFSLSNKEKKKNSQHSNSCPVWINQNYTYFGGSYWKKSILFGMPQNFSN